LIATSADHGRRPQAGPDLDGGKDPDRLVLTLNEGSDLIGLKLRGPEPCYFFVVETTVQSLAFSSQR
jgi:hypothetical protein